MTMEEHTSRWHTVGATVIALVGFFICLFFVAPIFEWVIDRWAFGSRAVGTSTSTEPGLVRLSIRSLVVSVGSTYVALWASERLFPRLNAAVIGLCLGVAVSLFAVMGIWSFVIGPRDTAAAMNLAIFLVFVIGPPLLLGLSEALELINSQPDAESEDIAIDAHSSRQQHTQHPPSDSQISQPLEWSSHAWFKSVFADEEESIEEFVSLRGHRYHWAIAAAIRGDLITFTSFVEREVFGDRLDRKVDWDQYESKKRYGEILRNQPIELLSRSLRVAARHGHTDIVRYIADLGAPNLDGALFAACRTGKIETMSLLASKGAELFQHRIVAVPNYCVRLQKVASAENATLRSDRPDHWLIRAIQEKDLDRINDLLLEWGETRGRYAQFGARLCVLWNYRDVFDHLENRFNNCATENQRNRDMPSLDVDDHLRRFARFPWRKDWTQVDCYRKAGDGPAARAARRGDAALFHARVRRGSKIGFDALPLAIESECAELIHYLVELGHDVNARVFNQRLIARVASQGNFRMTSLLLGLGADPWLESDSLDTAARYVWFGDKWAASEDRETLQSSIAKATGFTSASSPLLVERIAQIPDDPEHATTVKVGERPPPVQETPKNDDPELIEIDWPFFCGTDHTHYYEFEVASIPAARSLLEQCNAPYLVRRDHLVVNRDHDLLLRIGAVATSPRPE